MTINNYAPRESAPHRIRDDAPGEDQGARLLRAERIAHAIPALWVRAPALAQVAAAAAASDPRRAARLADEARQAALAIRDDMWQVKALGQAAVAAATGSYDLASRLADEAEHVISVTSRWKAQYLADLSVMTGGYDPGRSARLAREAEDAANALPDWDQPDALREAAVAQVTHDPSRAKRLVDRARHYDSLPWTAESHQDETLEKMALRVAARDPDLAMALIGFISADPKRDDARRRVSSALAPRDTRQAERIARTITSREVMDWALRYVGHAAASHDPYGAERIARTVSSGNTDWHGLARVAAAVARTDPGRAVRLADEVENAMNAISADGRTVEPSTLGWVASAVAAHDPGRAARLADQAEQGAQAIVSENDVTGSLTLRSMSEPFDDWDPDRAARIATMISVENWRAEALGRIAAAAARTNPDRAERIARSMTGDPSVPMAKVVEALTAGQ